MVRNPRIFSQDERGERERRNVRRERLVKGSRDSEYPERVDMSRASIRNAMIFALDHATLQ